VLKSWFASPWRATVFTLVAFAALGLLFMAVSERKDSAYWAGYADAQRWVDDGGYRAKDESISGYCSDRSATQSNPRSYDRGCRDGGGNAMKSVR
jgi:hypothetical protein